MFNFSLFGLVKKYLVCPVIIEVHSAGRAIRLPIIEMQFFSAFWAMCHKDTPFVKNRSFFHFNMFA